MITDQLLAEAIRAAKEGREIAAREMFLDVVRAEPGNKLAWLWLVGLLENLDERIAACDRALRIDPADEAVIKMRQTLAAERKKQRAAGTARLDQEILSIRRMCEEGRLVTAIYHLESLLREYPECEKGWVLLAEYAQQADQKRAALKRALALNPANESAREMQFWLDAAVQDWIDRASRLEEDGKVDDAIAVFREAAKRAKTDEDWTHIDHSIQRLEGLKAEKIVHVSPTLNIARLTAGPPLLYFSLMIFQMGLNPFYPAPGLWIGLLFCIGGAFLLALASIRSHHSIWKFFGEENTSGSTLSRLTLGGAGFLVMLMPFLLILLDSFIRLQRHVVPPPPFW